MPRLLRRDYGHGGPFTPEQVESTIKRHRVMGATLSHYAVAIFCDRETADRYWREAGREHDYRDLRGEIGSVCFEGDGNFSLHDAMRHSAESETHAGSDISAHGDHGHHGGSHH